MFEDLLPAVEKSILEASGTIPVVFEGIEHNFEKSTSVPVVSKHSSHELMYLRGGKTEFTINGKPVLLEKGSSVVIRPNVSHSIKVLSGHADMVVLYFGFSNDIREARKALCTPSVNARQSLEKRKTGPSVPAALSGISSATLESFMDFARGEGGEDAPSAPYLVISGKSRQDIAALVERIMKESIQDAFAKELMMQFLAMELLVTLSRALREEWEESLRVKHGKARELVLIARDYLVENHARLPKQGDVVMIPQGRGTVITVDLLREKVTVRLDNEEEADLVTVPATEAEVLSHKSKKPQQTCQKPSCKGKCPRMTGREEADGVNGGEQPDDDVFDIAGFPDEQPGDAAPVNGDAFDMDGESEE